MISKGVIYLACPYSHPDPKVKQMRYGAVTKKTAQLMNEGFIVFSPVTHSHPVVMTGLVDNTGHAFWLRQDLVFMGVCDELHVLMLEGWKESKGVKTEMAEAKRLCIPIIYEAA